ncbi:hypothetical protein [Aquimarina sp. EL_43]|uniref:hypothetical protein n=1 Tax=Aquimarina sp. EL_43 TaxID=2787736 RepID=UPI0020C1D0D2|nr:hypothetical protein [Aquimarina sp. EL_43]
MIRYQITNPNEYKELEQQITKALQECVLKINSLSDSDRSGVPECSTPKMEQVTKTKRAS